VTFFASRIELTTPKPQKFRSHYSKVVTALVVLPVAGLIVLASLYAYLLSPGVQKRVIASIRSPLAELGISVEMDDIRLDVFAGLNFQNLKLTIKRDPGLSANISVSTLRLSYSFWGLMRQKLVLREALLEGVRGQISVKQKSNPVSPDEKAFDLEALLTLLRKPPMAVSIPSMILKDVLVNAKIDTSNAILQASLDRAEVNASVNLSAGLLEVKTGTAFGAGLHLQSTSTDGSIRSIKIGRTSLVSDGSIIAKTGADRIDWSMSLSPSVFSCADILVTSDDKNGKAQFSASNLRISSDGSLTKTGTLSQRPSILDLISNSKIRGQNHVVFHNINVSTSNKDFTLGQFSFAQKANLTFNTDLFTGLHSWDITQKLKAERFLVRSKLSGDAKPKPVLAIPAWNWESKSSARDGSGSLKSESLIGGVDADGAAGLLTTSQTADLDFDIARGRIEGTSNIALNGTQLLSLTGRAVDKNGELNFASKLLLRTHDAWGVLIPKVANGFETLGWPQIVVDLTGKALHNQPLSQLNRDRLKQLSGDVLLNLTIKSDPRHEQSAQRMLRSITMDSKLEVLGQTNNNRQTQIKVKAGARVDGLRHQSLRNDASLKYSIAGAAELGDRLRAKLNDRLLVNEVPLFSSEINLRDQPDQLNVDHRMLIELSKTLIDALKLNKTVQGFGRIQIKGEHTLQYLHGRRTLLSSGQDEAKGGRLHIELADQLSQFISKDEERPSLRLQNPIQFNLSTDIVPNKWTGTLIYQAPSIRLAALEVKGLIGKGVFQSTGEPGPSSAEINLNTQINDVSIYQEDDFSRPTDHLLGQLRSLFLNLKASIYDKKKLTVNDLSAGFKDQLLQFSGQGQFLLGGAGQFDGSFVSRPSQSHELVRGAGSFYMPVTLKLYDKNRIAVRAEPRFSNYTLNWGNFDLSGVDGSFRISEDLRLDDNGKISFLFLRNQTPFARVDYESVEPYIDNPTTLNINSVSYKHIQLGPIEQSLEISQNLLLLNELRMNLLAGNAIGRAYLDLRPASLKMGFLGRFSGLKPELLKAPDDRLSAAEWAELGGRGALNFDVRKRLTSGRIDLTSIGKRQLLSVLDAVDPENQDNKISILKQALQIAHPRRVEVTMDQGLMDMAVAIRGAVSHDINVRSLPLSSFINSFAGEVLQKLDAALN
jgi:hypothetical protein